MASGGEGPAIDAARVIADLRELDRRTGGDEGARRLCWGDEWRQARAFLTELLAEIGLEPERDEAGNLWAQLEGDSEPAVAVGSHLDSVPAGGWLDGALGVMAALGVLRTWAGSGERPPRSLALVDWADEEGARFGRSLFGSSAFSGTLEPEEVRDLRDADGRALVEVLADNDVALGRVLECGARRESLGSYLELHIEQGPVLETEGAGPAAVSGCAGVERWRFGFRGQASHAGTTPMGVRRDAGVAAAATSVAVQAIPGVEGGVATVGQMELRPGVVTVIPGEATISVDLRNPDAGALARMLKGARDAATGIADQHGCELVAEEVWRIEPIPFDDELVALASAAVRDAGGRDRPMTSGALHDAAEVARVLPAAMVFVPSIAGISHAKEENTSDADLTTGIEAFGAFANAVLSRG